MEHTDRNANLLRTHCSSPHNDFVFLLSFSNSCADISLVSVICSGGYKSPETLAVVPRGKILVRQ